MDNSSTITPATSANSNDVSKTASFPSSENTVTAVQPGKITTRQFVGMAVGSSIGAGLLVASGIAMQQGGPASLVLGFAIIGPLVWHTMCALAELASSFPAKGSFYGYAFRFISPSWGFAMGWDYVLNWCLIMPFEITVIMILIEYWYPEEQGARLLLVVAVGMISVLGVIQYFGAKIYAEVEHGCGYIKATLLTAFIITALVDTGPAGGNKGFNNYLHGAAFLNGFRGFISVLVSTGVAYGGVESLGLAVKESQQPRKVLALSTWIVGARILILYVLAVFCVGLIITPDELELAVPKTLKIVSPFVAAVGVNNSMIYAQLVNAVLVICVFSMANAATFAASRSIEAICNEGHGPAVLARLSGSRQIPLRALGVLAVFCGLVFIMAAPSGHTIFMWLLSLVSVANYFTWITINWCHIRVRHALRDQDREKSQLKWQAPLGKWGSYISILGFVIVMIFQITSAIMPAVLGPDKNKDRVGRAFQGLLGFILFGALYFGHMIHVNRKREGTPWRHMFLIPLDQITLQELDTVVVKHEHLQPEAKV